MMLNLKIDLFDISSTYGLFIRNGDNILQLRFGISNFQLDWENEMSRNILHMLAPSRYDEVGALVGDLVALRELRAAIDDAIWTGAGGTILSQSDGEGYTLAVVLVPDMAPVCTSYAGEINPKRSKREMVSMRGLPRFMEAIRKSHRPRLIEAETIIRLPS